MGFNSAFKGLINVKVLSFQNTLENTVTEWDNFNKKKVLNSVTMKALE